MGEGPGEVAVLLRTDRLVLRGDAESDVDAVVALWTDPRVMHHMGGPRDPEKVRDAVRQNVAAPPADPCMLWNVVERDGGRFVGNCGLLRKDVEGQEEVELVYVLSPDAWGRGYATEAGAGLLDYAFGSLGVDRVVAIINPPNERSIRVAERLGFERGEVVVRPSGKERVLYWRQKPRTGP